MVLNKNILLVISLIVILGNKPIEKPCDWSFRPGSLIGVEIISGYTESGSNNLRLTEEGLLCTELEQPKHGGKSTKLYQFKDLDFNKIKKLQCYLVSNSNMLKDTIIDHPLIKINRMSLPLRIIIRNSWNKYTFIEFVDSDSPYAAVDSIVGLLNDIIPPQERDLFEIRANEYR